MGGYRIRLVVMKKTNTQNQAVEFDPTELAILETLIHTNDYVSKYTR